MFFKSVLEDFVKTLAEMGDQGKQSAMLELQQFCCSRGYTTKYKSDRDAEFAARVKIPVSGKIHSILVKYHKEAEEIKREASKMKALKDFQRINLPKLYGSAKHWLVTKYIDGETTNHQDSEKLLIAVNHLADIQSTNVTTLKSDASFREESSIQCEFVQFLNNVKDTILDKRDKLGAGAGSWLEKLKEIVRDCNTLFRDITNPRERDFVLSHGDYKPDNLLFARTSENSWRCHPVDWIFAAIRPRWYDIASLTEGCADSRGLADVYWNGYCNKLSSIDRTQAESSYYQHRILAALRVANANAHLSDEGKIKEFRRCLNSLDRLLDKLRSVSKLIQAS